MVQNMIVACIATVVLHYLHVKVCKIDNTLNCVRCQKLGVLNPQTLWRSHQEGCSIFGSSSLPLNAKRCNTQV